MQTPPAEASSIQDFQVQKSENWIECVRFKHNNQSEISSTLLQTTEEMDTTTPNVHENKLLRNDMQITVDKEPISQATEVLMKTSSSSTLSRQHSSKSSLAQICNQGSEDNESSLVKATVSSWLPAPPPPPSSKTESNGALLEPVTTADTSVMNSNADNNIFTKITSDLKKKNDSTTDERNTLGKELLITTNEETIHDVVSSSKKSVQRYKIDQLRKLRYLPASNRRPKMLNKLVDKNKLIPKHLITEPSRQSEPGFINILSDMDSQLNLLEPATASFNKSSIPPLTRASVLGRQLYNMGQPSDPQMNDSGINSNLHRAPIGISNFVATPKSSLGAADAPPFVPRHGFNNLAHSDYDEEKYSFSKENLRPAINQWKYPIDQDPAVSRYSVSFNPSRSIIESTQQHSSYQNRSVITQSRGYHDFDSVPRAFSKAFHAPATPNFPFSTASARNNGHSWNPLLWLKGGAAGVTSAKQYQKDFSEKERHPPLQHIDSGGARVSNESEFYESSKVGDQQQQADDLWDAPGRVPFNLNTSSPSLTEELLLPLEPSGVDLESYEDEHSEMYNSATNYFSSTNPLLNAEEPFMFFEEEGETEGSMFLKHIFNKNPQTRPPKESLQQLNYNNVGAQPMKAGTNSANNASTLKLLLQSAGLNNSMSVEQQRALKAKLAAVLNAERNAKILESNQYNKQRANPSYMQYCDEDLNSQANGAGFVNPMRNSHHFMLRPTAQQNPMNSLNNSQGNPHLPIPSQNQPSTTGRSPRTQQFNALMTAIIRALRPQMNSSSGNTPGQQQQNLKLTPSQQQAIKQLLEYYKQHRVIISQTALIDLLRQQLKPSSTPSATLNYNNNTPPLAPRTTIPERASTPGYFPHTTAAPKSRPFDDLSQMIGTPNNVFGGSINEAGCKLENNSEIYGHSSINTSDLLRNPGKASGSPIVMSPSKELFNAKRVQASAGTSSEELQRFLKSLQYPVNEIQGNQHSVLVQNGIQQHRNGFSLEQFKMSRRESPPTTPHQNFSQPLQSAGQMHVAEKLSALQSQQKLYERQQQLHNKLIDGSLMQSQGFSFGPNKPPGSPVAEKDSAKQKLFERQQQQKLFEKQQQQKLLERQLKKQSLDESLLQSQAVPFGPSTPDSPNLRKDSAKYRQQRLFLNQQQQFLLSQQQQQIQKLLNQSSGFNANAGVFIPRMDMTNLKGVSNSILNSDTNLELLQGDFSKKRISNRVVGIDAPTTENEKNM